MRSKPVNLLFVVLAFSLMFTAIAPLTAQDDPVRITMWDIPQSEPYTAWWEAYVERFNTENPDIQVAMEVFETDPYRTRLIGALNTNTAADIVYNAVGPIGFDYFRQGSFLALDGLLNTDLFSPGAIAQCSVDGQVVCMPLYLAPNFMYYNVDLFEQAGVDPQTWANPLQPTWEEFLAACDALLEAGIVPIALGNADQWPGLMWYAAFHNRFGGNEELFAARDGEGAYTAPGFIRGGEALQELNARGYLPMGFNGIAGEQKYTLFTQGEAAIIYQGPWMLGYIQDGAPEDFEFGIFSFPSFSDGNPDSQTDIQGGVDALWITSSSQNPEAAAEFLNGFAVPENAISFAVETQNISVIRSVEEQGLEGVLGTMVAETNRAADIVPWWDVALPAPVAEASLNNIQALFAGEMTPQTYAEALEAAAAR